MPLRPFSSPLAARLQKAFHTSAIRRDASTQPNHYEILQIPTDASPGEVKKSFYNLSKKFHPDLNPSDPHASKRFVLISEAYATLSSPTARTKYDSQHFPRHQHPNSSSSSRPSGSYSSSQAGGRPASGLSRRRTQFRGPPPSFYRSGGWGAHSAKRQEAQSNGAPGEQAPPNYNAQGGMGPGQGWAGEEVRHFDRREHLRTQENHDRRQKARRGDPWTEIEEGIDNRGTLGNFLFVGGIIMLGLSVPVMLAGQVLGAEKVDGNRKRG